MARATVRISVRSMIEWYLTEAGRFMFAAAA